MTMEKQNDGAGDGQNGENPGGPRGFSSAAGAKNFDHSESEKNHGEGFVLANFRVVRQAKKPGLVAEGPDRCR